MNCDNMKIQSLGTPYRACVTRWGLCAMLLVGAVAMLGATPKPPVSATDALQKALTHHWKGISGLSGDISVSGTMGFLPGVPLHSDGKGTVSILRYGKTLLLRIDLDTTMAVESQAQSAGLQSKIVSIFDGKYMNTLAELFGQKMLTKSDPTVNFTALAPLTGPALFTTLREDYALAVLPEQTVDGTAAYVLQGTLKVAYDDTLGPGSKLTLWFSKRDGMPLKTEMVDATGKPALRIRYANIKRNPPLTSKDFSLTVPEGAIVVDETS